MGRDNIQNIKGGPDFQHINCWIFDLDNTLYRADNGVFAQIEARMTDYVTNFLDLPREHAFMLQKDLYRRYGTTLNGLMQEHGADAEEYLGFVHDIDLSGLEPDPALAAAIKTLPGRRFVFTNGCRNHAMRVLGHLSMTDAFEGIWDIRTMGFVPKPEPSAYANVVKDAGIDCGQAAMFDDIARNLVPAHALGMTTVWLKTEAPWSRQGPQQDVADSDISHVTEDLADFLHTIRVQHV